LREKAPAELNNFRATLDSAVSRVAAAVGGVTAAESVMIEKIRRALGAGDRG